MGLIKIVTAGSFGGHNKTFSAQTHGHVDAVAQAIKWLAEDLLSEANVNDHKCHDQGIKPSDGWDHTASKDEES